MKHHDFYNLSYIAIFGCLWGVTEIVLGNILHAFDLPLKGTLLSALGCIICLVGYSLLTHPSRWPILSMGLIAMVIRLLAFGVFKIHIFVSLLTAALLMQITISLFGYRRMSCMLAGILACLSPYISGILFFGLIMGQGILFLVHGILKDSHGFGAVLWIGISSLLVLHLCLGLCAGLLAFYLGKQLKYAVQT